MTKENFDWLKKLMIKSYHTQEYLENKSFDLENSWEDFEMTCQDWADRGEWYNIWEIVFDATNTVLLHSFDELSKWTTLKTKGEHSIISFLESFESERNELQNQSTSDKIKSTGEN